MAEGSTSRSHFHAGPGTASTQQQEKICSQHGKKMEFYCRTDQSYICYLCKMHEHKGHDTVSAAEERTQRQPELGDIQRKAQKRLQEKEKKLQEVKQAVNTYKSLAQAAVKDRERVFPELIRSIERKCSDVTELIRDQEKNQLSQAEEFQEKLEQEIADLKRKKTELQQLEHTENHIQFLQSFQSLEVVSGCEDPSNITVHQHFSFDEVNNSVSDLKERVEEFCREEFSKISPHVAAVQKILSSEPKTRDDFLQYYRQLTLDPDTAHHKLRLSEKNRAVRNKGGQHPDHPDPPERFDSVLQVLSKESVSERCYWEVEWSRMANSVNVSVSYKEIRRKGDGNKCKFGRNAQSWSLENSEILSFRHNNIQTELPAPSPSRVGVYVDHSAGTLSFYSVSDTMTLLHTVHTTFTQPLYAGFEVGPGSSVKLYNPVKKFK